MDMVVFTSMNELWNEVRKFMKRNVALLWQLVTLLLLGYHHHQFRRDHLKEINTIIQP